MTGPLDGIKVLDLTMAAVGPWAAMVLASLGATVIKVERPQGDMMHIMPPYQGGLSTTYLHCNLNKLGTMLDLKSEEGRRDAYELVKDADVFMENMRPGVAAALGFDYATVAKINPRIVYGSFPGWGPTGPLKDLPAVDVIMQAFSGANSLTGKPDEPGQFLRYAAFHDLNAGCYVTAATLLGLLLRARTGEGQYVTTTQLGASMAMQITRMAEYFATGTTPPRSGSASTTTAPHEAFLCQNGRYLVVGVETDEQWRGLCAALDLNGLAEEPLYATNGARLANHDELHKLLQEVFSTKPTRWWTSVLREQQVPHGLVSDFEAIVSDPDVIANHHILYVSLPGRSSIHLGGMPLRFSGLETRMEPGVDPGADTQPVLRHGFKASDISGRG